MVDAHNVTLRAERGVRAEIRSTTVEPALIIKGAVILENLHISGTSESSPVVTVMYGRPRLKDCVIKCPGGGLKAAAGSNVSLINCLVVDCVYGIGLHLDSGKGLLQGIVPLPSVALPEGAGRTGVRGGAWGPEDGLCWLEGAQVCPALGVRNQSGVVCSRHRANDSVSLSLQPKRRGLEAYAATTTLHPVMSYSTPLHNPPLPSTPIPAEDTDAHADAVVRGHAGRKGREMVKGAGNIVPRRQRGL